MRTRRTKKMVYAQDRESMLEDNKRVRKRYVKLRRDNSELRDLAAGLTELMRTKDMSIHRELAYKVERSQGALGGRKHTAKMVALRDDMYTVAVLSERIRELEAELADKTRELAEAREVAATTKIQDLEADTQTQFQNAQRFARILSRLSAKVEAQRGDGKKNLESLAAAQDDNSPVSARTVQPMSARGAPRGPRQARSAMSLAREKQQQDTLNALKSGALRASIATEGLAVPNGTRVRLIVKQGSSTVFTSESAPCSDGKVTWNGPLNVKLDPQQMVDFECWDAKGAEGECFGTSIMSFDTLITSSPGSLVPITLPGKEFDDLGNIVVLGVTPSA